MEARNSGFSFQPLPFARDQWVTIPHDGADTRLLTRGPEAPAANVVLARIAAGAASVNRPLNGTRTVAFEFFSDRNLAPGWTVVAVDVAGQFRWERRPVMNSPDLSFRVTAASDRRSTGSVTVRTITLQGPVGAQWQEAF